MQSFATWLGSLEMLPTLTALRSHASEIAEQVIRENDGKWDTASERDIERVQAISRAIVNRLAGSPDGADQGAARRSGARPDGAGPRPVRTERRRG